MDLVTIRDKVDPYEVSPPTRGWTPGAPLDEAERVSPPTRGWTRCNAPASALIRGFPAHAGMDPDRCNRNPAHAGMDPAGRQPASGLRAVSPPTRGWTLDHAVGLHGLAVSPPTRGWTRPSACAQGADTVSPPTRGWTPKGRGVDDDAGHGFPAHAGMDRCQLTRRSPRRFPRPRGDGPCVNAWTATDSSVSPPTRGWTSSTRFPSVMLVSPPTRGWTHAQPASRIVSPRRGFPRPRGDGPCSIAAFRTCGRKRFPRPRGDGPLHICPFVDAGLSRFPRPRGDGPGTRRGRASAVGFPAHAGMDLDPRFCQRKKLGWAVSPPTRGWTHGDQVSGPGRGGFPAHAGMDLITPRGSADELEVSPPTRGWTLGSSACMVLRYGSPVSPPTRGWTRPRPG